MQSSVGLVFRALVMLACLALVPFLALYGKELPDFYKAVVDAYKARTQPKTPDVLAGLGSDAPAWAPTNDHRVTSPAPQHPSDASNAQSAAPPAADGPPAPWPTGTPAAQPLPNADHLSPAAPAVVQPASFALPLGNGKSPDPASKTLQAGANAASPPAPPDTCTAQFQHVEKRLRELGATYYLLETFGDGYRFYCEVTLAPDSDRSRKRVFQATNLEPLSAMKRVLDEVEIFRQQGADELGGYRSGGSTSK